jgi:pimeloyl-ACP methyl ester carboxylesterase
VELDCETWGERGDRVVLVHGDVFDGPATFETQRPLAADHRLVVVNRRGFGASPRVTGEDFDVDADDVAALLEQEPAHLVGHSYGGVVSLLAAARAPSSVRSLVVFEPPAFGLVLDRPHVQRFVAEIKHLLQEKPEPEEFLPAFVRAVGGDPSRLPHPLPEPLLRAAGVQMHGRWPWEATIPVEELARADFPKLVVSGGHSALFDAVCDVLEGALPADRAVHQGAGHSIPRLGAPVNQTLAAFWHSGDGGP